MSLLLLGGSSFVGSALRQLPDWPSTGRWTYRSGSHDDPLSIHLDLQDTLQVQSVLTQIAPTHVIDCALPGHEDPAEAALVARHICATLQSCRPDVRYLLVSSDAVFSGDAGRPYVESDPVDPSSPYGEAKAAVESIVRASLQNSCIARTCLVYGLDQRGTPPTLDARLAGIINPLREGHPVYAYTEQYRSPTYLDDLAPALLRLLYSNIRGILHLAGPVRCSRADFAREAAEAFSLNPSLVLNQPLPERPVFGRDTSLNSGRARDLLGWAPLDPQQGLAHLAALETALHRSHPTGAKHNG